jgi:hypothetical protein
LKEDIIYEIVLERLINEFSTMGGGSISGFATPVGSGPKAGASGEDIYKNQKETDKKHRSKKPKTKTKSVQWYLQNN